MKLNNRDKELIKRAIKLAKKGKRHKNKVFGSVGACLITDKGNNYDGLCLEYDCGIGTCGEFQAISSMIMNFEEKIDVIVAVSHDERILSPCGKCREMIYQTNGQNKDTWIILSNKEKIRLSKLLPHNWQKAWD